MVGPVPEHDSLPIAVIGAGVTGLATALALAKRGQAVRLFEATEQVGGPVQSFRDDEWLVEAGPNSLQEASPRIGELVRELGLEASRCDARPGAKNRYILRGGQLVAAPSSPPGLLTSKLFSVPARLRLFSEILRRPRSRTGDVSLADFIASHFGQELVDYGLNPFVSGVYAGDPQKLSARYAFPGLWAAEKSHGSLIRAQIQAAKEKRARGERTGPPPIFSFVDGLGCLPRALAEALPPGALELDARIETLVPDGAWKLVWSRQGETHTESFRRIVLTLPAASLARLTIGTLGERPLAELEAIEYPPVASLFLGYRREQVQHALDGFGALIPQREHRQILGVLFSSSLFPRRAPDGHVALTVMFGGTARPDLGRAPIEQLLPLAQNELGDLLGLQGDPVYVRHHAWPRAIPQYNLGYHRFLDAMSRCEQSHPGLLIGGHVRDGIALSSCLAAGTKLAERASR
jgi:protoporphyrinogen/coproporphyrinogen III oxidase